jgi:hypothetical protein
MHSLEFTTLPLLYGFWPGVRQKFCNLQIKIITIPKLFLLPNLVTLQQKMPTIKILDSVKIDLYSREHPPPYFHAIYADYEALITIQDFCVYAGKLPKSQLNKVIDWARDNQQMLMGNFKRLNPRL